jgi:hypothetical protein
MGEKVIGRVEEEVGKRLVEKRNRMSEEVKELTRKLNLEYEQRLNDKIKEL